MSTPLIPHGRSSLKRVYGLLVLGLIVVVGLATFLGLIKNRESNGELVPRERLVIWRGDSSGAFGSGSRADARFELDNVGGAPVRILSVESGCGCARPTVRPAVVAPGIVATVEVSALSVPVGYRDVQITLHTDSATSPDISLTLRVMGTRKPPFLHLVRGNLSFRGRFSDDLGREFTIATVEPRDGRAVEEVEVSSDLPFLKFEATGVEEQPYPDTDAVLRRRGYMVRFAEKPPGAFAGSIVVKDPWEPRTTQSLSISGRFHSGLTATPARLFLDGSENAEASLIVITDEPTAGLELELEGSSNIPLDIEEKGLGNARRARRFTVTLKGPTSWTGQASIKICDPGSQESLIIPVTVVSPK